MSTCRHASDLFVTLPSSRVISSAVRKDIPLFYSSANLAVG